ncbi:MAG TPA: 2-C-methyl-D-erythritol 4-phosphate cytidylyltransferase [Bacillota bacterium]|nr:2-C-methyl-D-erythritol 4-phosphate cytidylyltransferase [Bacillota bacterium]
MPLSEILAIIPAAGQGKRMGNQVNKQFLCLAGLPILVHTLTAFEKHSEISGLVVVCREEEVEYCRTEIIEKYGLRKVFAVVAGGQERQQSVLNGLKAVAGQADYVLIHDGARPFVTADIINRSLAAAITTRAAVAAVPVKDTIKEATAGGLVTGTPDRARLWQVQTPQAFDYQLIRRAYDLAEAEGFLGTDDASLVERMGEPVKLVLGSYENIKVTTQEDLWLGEAILARRTNEQD